MKTATYSTLIILITAAAVGLGCGGNQPAKPTDLGTVSVPAATQPPAHKTRALPTATLPDGWSLKLELAISPEEISQGMMFRTSLPEDRGMLFLFEEQRLPSFWMKNTLIPLDIIFLDGDGVVVDIVHDAQPCKVEPCPHYVSNNLSLAVLELAAGSARKRGLVEGSRITFARVPGYPKSSES